jgi:hypothetical protein
VPREWKYIKRLVMEDGKVAQYSISFYREGADGWYDEVRYDSHDRRRGRKVLAPRSHIKLGTAFKGEAGRAVEELREIIDTYVERMEEVLWR